MRIIVLFIAAVIGALRHGRKTKCFSEAHKLMFLMFYHAPFYLLGAVSFIVLGLGYILSLPSSNKTPLQPSSVLFSSVSAPACGSAFACAIFAPQSNVGLLGSGFCDAVSSNFLEDRGHHFSTGPVSQTTSQSSPHAKMQKELVGTE
jgi:hypothetical protein